MAPDERLHHWQSRTWKGWWERHWFPCGAEQGSGKEAHGSSQNPHCRMNWRASKSPPRHLCSVLWKPQYALDLLWPVLHSPHLKERCLLRTSCWAGGTTSLPLPLFGSGLNWDTWQLNDWQGSIKGREVQVKAGQGPGLGLSESVPPLSSKPMSFLQLCECQPRVYRQTGLFPVHLQDKLLSPSTQ